MKKFNVTLTSDFKNSTTRKVFDCEIFVARYNNGEYYKIFCEREDDRRQVMTLSGETMELLIRQIQSLST